MAREYVNSFKEENKEVIRLANALGEPYEKESMDAMFWKYLK